MAIAVDIRSIRPEATYALRHQVLWPDKPLAYVKVENDDLGQHFGAFQHDELVAVISLFVENQTARFRKFATRPDWQRQGIGSALLEHVFGEAQRLGATHIWAMPGRTVVVSMPGSGCAPRAKRSTKVLWPTCVWQLHCEGYPKNSAYQVKPQLPRFD